MCQACGGGNGGHTGGGSSSSNYPSYRSSYRVPNHSKDWTPRQWVVLAVIVVVLLFAYSAI